MRYVAMAVVALGLGLILWLALRPSEDATPSTTTPASTPTTGGPTATPSPATKASDDAAAGDTPRVRKLDREARKRLGEQIEAARARARANAPAGSAADEMLDLEVVAAPVRDAMLQAIPILAECYTARDPSTRAARARMMLTSDPELGTVIDTDAVTDGDSGQPLPAALEECLRDTIDTLGLPPLALDAGGRLRLEYSFRFDDD